MGETTARLLAINYISADRFLDEMLKLGDTISSASDDLKAIDGIGPKVVDSIADFFGEDHNRKVVAELRREITILDAEVPSEETPIAGKTLVFTGTMQEMTRSEAKARAEAMGARVSSSISARTDFLVAGPGAGSKLKKALDLKVQVLDEKAWLKLTRT